MGKSGLIAQKISAALASTGTTSVYLHPVEAVHGALGRIVKGDVLLALSYSGDTDEILALVPQVKRLGSPLVAMTGNPRSSVAQAADVNLDVSIREEACPLGLAPTASTTAALAMGDALSMALIERRGFTVEDFAVLHPGGHLGKKLLRVEDLMNTGEQIPRVSPETAMKEVLFEMTRKPLGLTTVTDPDTRPLATTSDCHLPGGRAVGLVHPAGLGTGLGSGRASGGGARRAAELGMAVVRQGVRDKGAALGEILAEQGLGAQEVAYIGDDVNDLPIMHAVALSAAPADAPFEVRSQAFMVMEARGGRGCLREFVEAILRARADWERAATAVGASLPSSG